jgi:hypothetical protein
MVLAQVVALEVFVPLEYVVFEINLGYHYRLSAVFVAPNWGNTECPIHPALTPLHKGVDFFLEGYYCIMTFIRDANYDYVAPL